jgi:protein gp37
VKLHPEKLDEPLRLRKPSTIGVSLMGDLFHDDVPTRYIDDVLATMGQCPRHLFIVLTKRAERMRKVMSANLRHDAVVAAMHEQGRRIEATWPKAKLLTQYADRASDGCDFRFTAWPLPNVFLGVSCEDQATADERIPILLDTPAAHRFVSLEPQIGKVDLSRWLRVAWRCSGCGGYFGGKWQKVCPDCGKEDYWCGSHKFNGHDGPFPSQAGRAIDLVIQGCESGPRRRPFDHDWARLTRDQCAASGTAWYYKQAPDRVSPSVIVEKPTLDGLRYTDLPWVVPA